MNKSGSYLLTLLCLCALYKANAQNSYSLVFSTHSHFPLFSENGGTGQYLNQGISTKKVISYKLGGGLGIQGTLRVKNDSSSLGFETGIIASSGFSVLYSELLADTFPKPWNYNEISHHSVLLPTGFYIPYSIHNVSFSTSFGILLPLFRRTAEKETRSSMQQNDKIYRNTYYRWVPGLYFRQNLELPLKNSWVFSASLQYHFLLASRSKRKVSRVWVNNEEVSKEAYFKEVIYRDQVYLTNNEISERAYLNDPSANPNNFDPSKPLESTPVTENLSVIGVAFGFIYRF